MNHQVPSEHLGILSDEERKVFVEWIDLGAQWGLPEEVLVNQQGEAGS